MSLHPRWIGAARHSGRVAFGPIFRKIGGASAFASAPESILFEAGLPQSVLLAACTESTNSSAKDTVLFLGEPGYPPPLLDLLKPPPLLWARGNTNLLNQPGLAVVGSRACTPYGKSVAGQLGQMEAAAGGVLVSGAARGIDSCAHRGAMDAGRTIAVLGAGLEAAASFARKALIQEIVESGGLILSEFPLYDPPSRWTFPQRNRLVAALSRATVVVEAASRSGARITAGFARDLGREVFAVPGRIDAPASMGCNELIQEGARPLVRLAEAVLDRAHMQRSQLPLVLKHLLGGPLSLGELSLRTGLEVRNLSEQIGHFELNGLIARRPGGLLALP